MKFTWKMERIGDKYDIPYEIIIDFAHTPDGMKIF